MTRTMTTMTMATTMTTKMTMTITMHDDEDDDDDAINSYKQACLTSVRHVALTIFSLQQYAMSTALFIAVTEATNT
eukprot:11011695-Karenia_brevis.AAC.1